MDQDLKTSGRARRTTAALSDRLPPHSVEAEQGVLGCVLLESAKAMPELATKIGERAEAFYDLRHQAIYAAACRMFSSGRGVDLITLQQELADSRQLEAVGGVGYLSSLADIVPSVANLSYYADILIEKLTLRRVIATAADAVAKAYEQESDVEGLLGDFERAVLAIRSGAPSGRQSMRDLVLEAITEVERLAASQGQISGIATGFTDLDRMTDGLQPSEFTVLAGFPSTGKTALAANIASHVAAANKIPTAVFSLEMSPKSIAVRLLSSEARLDLRRVRDSGMAERDFASTTAAAGRLVGAPMHIDGRSDLSIYALRAAVRSLCSVEGVKLVVVDYIQLMNASGMGRASDNREQEVAAISRGLKAAARETGAHVLALSQLNDDGKLRESRAIGQDADGVWVLKVDPDGHGDGATAVTLDLQKQRNGPTGLVKLAFMKAYTRFENAARVQYDE